MFYLAIIMSIAEAKYVTTVSEEGKDDMDTLGVGIVGCGSVAEEYVKAFGADERSEVRALVSRNRANADRYRDR